MDTEMEALWFEMMMSEKCLQADISLIEQARQELEDEAVKRDGEYEEMRKIIKKRKIGTTYMVGLIFWR